MKTKLLSLLLGLFCAISAFSQTDTSTVPTDRFVMQKKSALYVELLGNSATIFSINYDRILKEFKDAYLNMSIGFGNSFGLNEKKGFNVPFSINYTIGKNTNHHFEIGLGGGINYLKDDKATRMLLNGRVGYKYQRPQGGFFFRAAFTPITPLFYFNSPEGYIPDTLFNNNGTSGLRDLDLVFHAIGISFGRSF